MLILCQAGVNLLTGAVHEYTVNLTSTFIAGQHVRVRHQEGRKINVTVEWSVARDRNWHLWMLLRWSHKTRR